MSKSANVASHSPNLGLFWLVSTCAETDFFPSLSDLDKLLNSLVIH